MIGMNHSKEANLMSNKNNFLSTLSTSDQTS